MLALGFASGLSLSGHSAVDAGSSWLSELADWVHLAAASLWVGGLVSSRSSSGRSRRSCAATAFLALLAARDGADRRRCSSAGIYLSVIRLPHLADLWTSSYGQVLLVKLALVSLALAVGRACTTSSCGRRSSAGAPPFSGLPRSLIGESAVGMAILLVAAVLVDSKPPPQPGAEAPAALHATAPRR